MLKDSHAGQQHSGPQNEVLQLQQEVTRLPRHCLKLPCPRSVGCMGEKSGDNK